MGASFVVIESFEVVEVEEDEEVEGDKGSAGSDEGGKLLSPKFRFPPKPSFFEFLCQSNRISLITRKTFRFANSRFFFLFTTSFNVSVLILPVFAFIIIFIGVYVGLFIFLLFFPLPFLTPLFSFGSLRVIRFTVYFVSRMCTNRTD